MIYRDILRLVNEYVEGPLAQKLAHRYDRVTTSRFLDATPHRAVGFLDRWHPSSEPTR